jgi:hypothetical protein
MPPPMLDKRTMLDAAEEAKNMPTNFDAKTRSAFIEEQVSIVRELVAKHKTDSEIKEVCPDFAINYPILFEYSLKPNFDVQNLRIMLTLMNRMGENQMSQHQASVIVGQRMSDKFIKPTLSNA